MAGGLQSARGAVHFATSADTHYQSFYSVVLLAVLALAPFAEPWYAVFAGLTAVIPAYLTGGNTTDWLNFLFGFFAIQVALQGGHPAMPAPFQRFFERFRREPHGAPTPGAAPAARRVSADATGPSGRYHCCPGIAHDADGQAANLARRWA